MANETYGAVVGAHQIDKAIFDTLNYWTPSYLNEVARRSGEDADELRPFRGWRISNELEHMPEDQTPTCIIANRGTFDEPFKYNGATRPGQHYEATWNYRIGAHVSAKGVKYNAAPRAQTLAKMYCLAIRLCLIQKRDEPDLMTGARILNNMIDWIGENYDGLESEDDRTICLAYCDFHVVVSEVATWGAGPKEPEATPDPSIPTDPVIQTIIPGLIKVPTDQDIDDFIEANQP